jgi:hypothetical protein
LATLTGKVVNGIKSNPISQQRSGVFLFSNALKGVMGGLHGFQPYARTEDIQGNRSLRPGRDSPLVRGGGPQSLILDTEIRTDLPVTLVGKIDKKVLRKETGEG